MIERRPTPPTPVPDQQQAPQEGGKGRPEIIETPRTGQRYRKSREESLERARWYMQHRRDFTENPPSEEEMKRAQEREKRVTRYLRNREEYFKAPPTEGSDQDTL
jgi:hypothetical protein